MPQHEEGTYKFPSGFLWGAATSSHQVEGYNKFNDWWSWEKEGKAKERSGEAACHYQLFKQDIRLAKELNHNAFRFSVEWSRIEPKEGQWNKEALVHYKEVINFCRSLDIEPIVTINHFTLPLWFYNLGGWKNKRSVEYFTAFTEKLVDFIGEKVRFWIVFNEPIIYIYKSYLEGSWPPGRRSFLDAVIIFKNLICACTAAYKAIHKIYKSRTWGEVKAGISKNLLVFKPCSSKSLLDRFTVFARDYCFNYLFIKLLANRRAQDFIGVNYYKRDFVHNLGLKPSGFFGHICPLEHQHAKGKRSCLGWEVYPEGLSRKLVEYSKFKLPLFIVENGICSENDKDRWQYIQSHLKEVSSAISEGVPVIGYLYWSLIDNFEWADGFSPRFGLVEIDYKTQERHARESAYKFASVCKENVLKAEDRQ